MRIIQKTNPSLSTMRALGKRKLLSPSTISTISTQPPPIKRRKVSISEPILTIIIGPHEERIYFYQPQKMVNHSRYIRTKLMASLMKELRDPYTLCVPDVSPADWDLMMKYVECSEGLNLEDANRLRSWYDRYGFEEGVKLCDQKIAFEEGVKLCDRTISEKIIDN